MTSPLRRELLAGVGWNYAASAVTMGAQIGYTAATARILVPRDFGAYAAAFSLAGLAAFFGSGSLGNALIRLDRLTDRLVGTATALALLAGTSVAVLVFLVAPLWAAAWHVKEAETLVRILALGVFFVSAGVVPLALLRRSMRFRAAATVESTGQLIGLATGVAAAAATGSAIALAIGYLAATSTTAALATASARRDLRVRFGRPEARRLLSFATQVSGQNVGYYTLYTLPSWIVARWFGVASLGFYSRAHSLVWLPLSHIAAGLTKAMYPLYSRASGPAERRDLVESTLVASTAVLWPAFAAVAGAASPLVMVLLGPGWDEVAELVRPLLLFAAVNVAFVIAGNPLEARGHLRHAWSIQAAWAVALGVALSSAVAMEWPIAGVVLSVAFVQITAHALQVSVVARLGYLRLRAVSTAYAVNASVAVVFFLAAFATDRALSSAVAPVRLGACAAVTVALAVLSVAVLRRQVDAVVIRRFRSNDSVAVSLPEAPA